MTLFYFLLALLVLAILIIAHEFGHFISARLCGIEVREFSIGFGPVLLGKTTKHGTKLSLRAFPLGGFCAFYGEDDAEGVSDSDPRSFNRQAVWKRMITVLMGPVMNFILALIVSIGFYWVNGATVLTGTYEPYLTQVEAGGPAYEAGLQADDQILSVNDVNVCSDSAEAFTDVVRAWNPGDEPLLITYRRGDEVMSASMTPFFDEELSRNRIGVMLRIVARTEVQPCSFLQACQYGWDWCTYAGGAIADALKKLVTTGEGLSETTGPVGLISTMTTEMQENGSETFFGLLIVISINLGIMNLLPFPGLDGSRFLFMIFEAIRRKPVPPRKEAMVHLTGYVILFALIAVITVRDIMKLF